MATSGVLGGYLDEDAAREIYGNAGTTVGGVFAPRGRAVADGARAGRDRPLAVRKRQPVLRLAHGRLHHRDRRRTSRSSGW